MDAFMLVIFLVTFLFVLVVAGALGDYLVFLNERNVQKSQYVGASVGSVLKPKNELVLRS